MSYKDLIDEANRKAIIDWQKRIEKLNIQLNEERNKKTYQIHSIRHRKVLTRFGWLEYKRYVYCHYNSNIGKIEYVNFVDDKIGVCKYKKVHSSLVEEIIDQLPKGKRYRDILDMFTTDLSAMTISRYFKKHETKRWDNLAKIVLKPGQRLYINLDDAFVPVIKNNKRIKRRIRSFTFYTGEKKIFKSRKQLVNKRVDYLVVDEKKVINTVKFCEEILKSGREFYENFDQARLVVGGDGATWIKHVATNLKATYVLDKFHAIKMLRDQFIRGKKKYSKSNWFVFKTCKTYLETGKVNDLLRVLRNLGSKNIYNYFSSNRQGIKAYKEKWNLGVSAESDVVRLTKSLLGHGAKIFNWQTYNHMLEARAYSINTTGGF